MQGRVVRQLSIFLAIEVGLLTLETNELDQSRLGTGRDVDGVFIREAAAQEPAIRDRDRGFERGSCLFLGQEAHLQAVEIGDVNDATGKGEGQRRLRPVKELLTSASAATVDEHPEFVEAQKNFFFFFIFLFAGRGG